MIYGNEAFLEQHFEKVEGGWLAYKVFNMFWEAPPEWTIAKGETLLDVVDPDIDADCSAGINCGPSVSWLRDFVDYESLTQDINGEVDAQIWQLFVPDDADIVIPRITGGKIRVSEARLVEVVGTLLYQNHPQHPYYEAV